MGAEHCGCPDAQQSDGDGQGMSSANNTLLLKQMFDTIFFGNKIKNIPINCETLKSNL